MITLSASTLGAPGTSIDQVLLWLQEADVHAVELRLSQGQIAYPAMSRSARKSLRDKIQDAGIRVSGVASYVSVGSPAEDDLITGALVAALEFASDIGSPTVRVFPGAATAHGPFDRRPWLLEDREEVDSRAARRLTAVVDYAQEVGVIPALETHDSHPTGEDVAGILARVDGPVGAIWDLMHPWRVGERLEDTWKALQPWLNDGGVQVKDAALPGDATPMPIGAGHLPTEAFARILQTHGYCGTVTLEWEKAWHPAAAELPVALRSATNWVETYWPDNVGLRH